MPTLWQNALVIAMDDEHGSVPFRADVHIDGDRIVRVHARADSSGRADGSQLGDPPPPATDVIDATHLLIHPGLINAHTHSWEILFRGSSERLPLELWSLVSYPPVGLTAVPERLIRLRTLVAGIESLLGGTTSLLDDVGEVPEQTPESLRAVMDAYGEIGIRANCAGFAGDVPLVDRLPFAEEAFSADVLARSRAAVPSGPDVIERFLAFSADATSYTAQFGGRIRYVVAPSAPHRVSDELFLACADFAREHDLVLHLHLLETRVQAVRAAQLWGTTAVRHLADLGILGPKVTLAHGIWLTEEDRALVAASGATIAHNPLSNLKLGSGRLGWRELHSAGARLALGSDGASSSDSMRMLDIVKSAALLHTLHGPAYEEWPSTDEVLRAAFTGGAAAVGQSGSIGRIAAGAKADLVVIDMTRGTAFTPLHDAARQLVYSENGSSIAQVWVDGRLVVEDGRCLLIDQAAVLAEFRREAEAYLAAHSDHIAANAVHAPAVDAAYRLAWKEPLA